MSSTVTPYVMFGGNCEQALEFYRTALGAKIEMVMRYKENPDPPPPGFLPPGMDDKIMHASLRIDGAALMASDCPGPAPSLDGVAIALEMPTAAAVAKAFAALSEGGTITMPLGKTFWTPSFGMVTDRFGVSWMVMVAVPMPDEKKKPAKKAGKKAAKKAASKPAAKKGAKKAAKKAAKKGAKKAARR